MGNRINSTRRKVLKTFSSTAIGLTATNTVPNLGGVDVATADSTPEEHYPATDKAENNANANIGVYLGIDVGEFGAQWDDTRNIWEYHFRIDSAGCSEYTDGGDLNAIRAQRLMVNQGSTHAVWKSPSNPYLGVHPKFVQDDYDYTDVAWDLAEVALAQVSKMAEFALTVNDMMNKMHNDAGDESGNYEIDHLWDYNEEGWVYGDVTNFMWWIVELKSGESGYFDVTSRLEGTYDNDCEITMGFNIGEDGPTPESSTADTNDQSTDGFDAPETFTKEQMEKYGVEVIPHREIDKRAKELNLPPESVARMKASSGPAYFAHNPPCELAKVEKSAN